MLILQKVAVKESQPAPAGGQDGEPAGQEPQQSAGSLANSSSSLQDGQQPPGQPAAAPAPGPQPQPQLHQADQQAAQSGPAPQQAGGLAAQQQQASALKYMVMAGTAEKMLGKCRRRQTGAIFVALPAGADGRRGPPRGPPLFWARPSNHDDDR